MYSTISEEDIEADGYVDLEEGDCRLLITLKSNYNSAARIMTQKNRNKDAEKK